MRFKSRLKKIWDELVFWTGAVLFLFTAAGVFLLLWWIDRMRFVL